MFNATIGISATSGQISYSEQINIASLGDRVATAGTMFLRYRIKSLVFQFRSALPVVTAGAVALGIADDTAVTSASLTTPQQVIALRTSRMAHPYQNVSLRWSPIDKQKWFFLNPESSAADARWTNPCTVFVVHSDTIGFWSTSSTFTALTNGSAVYAYDIHYVVEFEGATTVAV